MVKSTTERHSRYILGPQEEGKCPVMPCNQVHTIAGGSGTGKTTLVFQLIRAMQEGTDFFGLKTQRHPLAYITFDRDEEETVETIERIWPEACDTDALKVTGIPIICLPIVKPDAQRRGQDHRMDAAFATILAKAPEARAWIMDGLYTLCPDGDLNNYLNVAEWFQRMRDFCKANDITLIGITHAPKQREGNRIIEPRQMLLGSVAGGGFSSSGIVIFQDKPESDNRTIYILPRNGANIRINAVFDHNGALRESAVELENIALYLWEAVLAPMPSEQVFSLQDLMPAMEKVQAARPTVHRHLNQLVAQGKVRKIKYGLYQLAPAQTSSSATLPAKEAGK